MALTTVLRTNVLHCDTNGDQWRFQVEAGVPCRDTFSFAPEGLPRIFHEGKIERLKAEGRERGWDSWGGGSNPLPTS